MLASGINRRAGAAFVPKGRRDVDDAAATLGLHHAQFVFHAEDCAEDVGVEGRGIAFHGLLDSRAGFALGAGGVDGNVEPAEALHGLVDERSNVVLMAHIGADKLGFRAGGAQLGDERGACVFVTTGGNDLRPFLGKGESGGAGDAVSAPVIRTTGVFISFPFETALWLVMPGLPGWTAVRRPA